MREWTSEFQMIKLSKFLRLHIENKISHYRCSTGVLQLLNWCKTSSGHKMAALTWALIYEQPCCDVRGRGYLLNVAYPVSDVIEGFLVGDVIHQHDALNTKDRKWLQRKWHTLWHHYRKWLSYIYLFIPNDLYCQCLLLDTNPIRCYQTNKTTFHWSFETTDLI